MSVLCYRLVVLTHGGGGNTLVPTLEAFAEHVMPEPVDTVIVSDGSPLPDIELPGIRGWHTWVATGGHVGFCKATAIAWERGSRPDCTHAFHLEHDFLITRDIDLEQLAFVLRVNTHLAQMQLMRDAVNDEEKAAGGLFESRPGEYRQRFTSRAFGGDGTQEEFDWLEHTSYFSTNPSLMRTSFMRDIPFPRFGPACEGHFGRELVARDYSFGVWGEGSPWCRHIGIRTGHSY